MTGSLANQYIDFCDRVVSTHRIASEVSELLDRIDSIEKLQIVRRVAQSGGSMSRDALRGICADADDLDRAIRELCEHQILATSPHNGVALGSGATPQTLAALLQLYDDDRGTVVWLLSIRSIDRLRRLAAYTFGNVIHPPKPKPDR